jgi:hypothetical protein
MTNYQLQTNDQVTLTWWAEHTGGSGGSTQSVSLLSAPYATAAYAGATALSSTNGPVNGNGSSSGPWAQYTLTYTATAADAGNFVGVYFNNATSSNWSGFDDFNISVASAPYAPLGLTADDGDAAVSLSWTASDHATSYNVKRGAVSGVYPTIINVSGTTYNDTSVTNGMTYYYAVSAVNSLGEGANSDQISATPSSPITAIESLCGRFSLSGTSGGGTTAVFTSSVPGHTYTIQYSPNLTTGSWTSVGPAVMGTGGSVAFPPIVITGTEGFYRVLIQRE